MNFIINEERLTAAEYIDFLKKPTSASCANTSVKVSGKCL